MSLLSSVGDFFGLSGRESDGRRASGQLADIANKVRNFTPVRIRSLIGTGTYDKEGSSFDLDPRLRTGAETMLNFFGNSASRLAAFDDGDASARTLALLRARRAEMFNSTLSRLESRLLQQGRIGLGTGGRNANPEMSSFFGAEAMADLEAQLAALDEARKQRDSLMQSTAGGLALAQESAFPTKLMQGLFDTESLRVSRELAAAKIEAGGPAMELAGANADRDTRAGFFGSFISSFFPKPKPQG